MKNTRTFAYGATGAYYVKKSCIGLSGEHTGYDYRSNFTGKAYVQHLTYMRNVGQKK